MLLKIISGIIAFLSFSILILYRRQVRAICRQLRFIEEKDTNKLIATNVDMKEIMDLADAVNGILIKQQRLNVKYTRNNQQLKEIITYLSHDIRTPLTSLSGYFELLNECKEESERERYTKIIESRITNLNEMLDQLFIYAKLQNEDYKLPLEKCNINKILYSCAFSFYDDFKRKFIEPTLIIPEETYYVLANEAGLNRVIQNVIKNALDHGNEIINIEMKMQKDRVEVLIKNGYNNAEMIDTKKVFNRFYQAETSRSSLSTGLGLSIASELIHSMNGRIMAYTEEELFVVRIEFEGNQDHPTG